MKNRFDISEYLDEVVQVNKKGIDSLSYTDYIRFKRAYNHYVKFYDTCWRFESDMNWEDSIVKKSLDTLILDIYTIIYKYERSELYVALLKERNLKFTKYHRYLVFSWIVSMFLSILSNFMIHDSLVCLVGIVLIILGCIKNHPKFARYHTLGDRSEN